MQTKTLIKRIDNKPAEIWGIISNCETPEAWVPLLDSRYLISKEKKIGTYFAAGTARSIGKALVRYKVLTLNPEERELNFFLDFSNVKIFFLIKIYDLKGALIECTLTAEENNSPELISEDLLSMLSNELMDNIKVLASALYSTNPQLTTSSRPARPLSEKILNGNVLDIKSISFSEGINNAIENSYPVIVRDYGNFTENFELINTYDWWKESFGGQTVPFSLFENLAYGKGDKKGSTTLRNFISLIEANPNKLKLAIYELRVSAIIGLHSFLNMPKIIPSDSIAQPPIIWIGAVGVSSPLHQDIIIPDQTGAHPDKYHNINFQVIGRKRVILSHPNQSEYLYTAPPQLDKLSFPASDINVFDEIPMAEYPNITKATFYEAVLNPGDLIYIPRGWWHAFHAESNSININTFFRHDYF